ncbi:MAG TPA: class I SAM-dependent methyltransferase [Candidatus Limnocylindria bacterium]|nr:class I SAM-dependent methyltransferase [Candidatus Limnocylindria bacterium]
MDHADHVRLLKGGVPRGGRWADLGAGTGAFTLALAELVGPGGEVIAVDRDARALGELEAAVTRGGATVRTMRADFTRAMDLASLDGVVMANSLHFVRDKAAALAHVHRLLRPGGRLVLVEYDADRGNEWVPYPLTFETWRDLADANGFGETRKLASVPSRFLHAIFSALSLRA